MVFTLIVSYFLKFSQHATKFSEQNLEPTLPTRRIGSATRLAGSGLKWIRPSDPRERRQGLMSLFFRLFDYKI